MTPAERGLRRRQRLFVIFTVALLLAYARQLAGAPTAGQDFRAFFAAATVAAHGGDPYDWAALSRTEEALYNAPAQVTPGDSRYYDFLPYPEGPWLALIDFREAAAAEGSTATDGPAQVQAVRPRLDPSLFISVEEPADVDGFLRADLEARAPAPGPARGPSPRTREVVRWRRWPRRSR